MRFPAASRSLGLGDTNLGEGVTPFCVTGPRDGDGIIGLIRKGGGGGVDQDGHVSDPPQPESIWWEADNDSVNVLCPSVRDPQYGRCAKEMEEVLLSLPSFPLPLFLSFT